MKIFRLVGGLMNLAYLAAMLFGLTILIFLFILVFPAVVGIVFALLVAAGIVLGVRQHIEDTRVEETES